jgi:hypothetical protein
MDDTNFKNNQEKIKRGNYYKFNKKPLSKVAFL